MLTNSGLGNRRYLPKPVWLDKIQKRQSVFVHVGLAFGALIYMVMGAYVFMWLEVGDGTAPPEVPTVIPLDRRKCLVYSLRNVSLTDKQTVQMVGDCFTEVDVAKWGFGTALLFTFTVITTIGYGNIAPITNFGRIFCIVYGLIGIPLTMMAIANVGKFLMEIGRQLMDKVKRLLRYLHRWRRRWRRRRRRKLKQTAANDTIYKLKTTPRANNTVNNNNNTINDSNNGTFATNVNTFTVETHLNHLDIEAACTTEETTLRDSEPDTAMLTASSYAHDEQNNNNNNSTDAATSNNNKKSIVAAEEAIAPEDDDASTVAGGDEEEEDDEELSGGVQTMCVLLVFLMYVVIGGVFLPLYEADMTFFTALYFNFVTLTTVGLGDMVPTSERFMAFTMIYITIGLALTTIAIEVASDYLQKLHHLGRKVQNTGNAAIWFGGKKINVKTLMQNVGEKYGIKELEDFKPTVMNNIVVAAIQKDEDPTFELPNMRPPSPSPVPTPKEPTPEPTPVPTPPREPTPEPTPPPSPEPIGDESLLVTFEPVLVQSESNPNLGRCYSTPSILTPTADVARECYEMVPSLVTFQCDDCLTSETLAARFAQSPTLEHQQLPPPTPPPSPPKLSEQRVCLERPDLQSSTLVAQASAAHREHAALFVANAVSESVVPVAATLIGHLKSPAPVSQATTVGMEHAILLAVVTYKPSQPVREEMIRHLRLELRSPARVTEAPAAEAEFVTPLLDTSVSDTASWFLGADSPTSSEYSETTRVRSVKRRALLEPTQASLRRRRSVDEAKAKRKPKREKVDLSYQKVNDPKLRYELYQKEWARYNAHLLEIKNQKEQARKDREKKASLDKLTISHADSRRSSSHVSPSPLPSRPTSPSSSRTGPSTSRRNMSMAASAGSARGSQASLASGNTSRRTSSVANSSHHSQRGGGGDGSINNSRSGSPSSSVSSPRATTADKRPTAASSRTSSSSGKTSVASTTATTAAKRKKGTAGQRTAPADKR